MVFFDAIQSGDALLIDAGADVRLLLAASADPTPASTGGGRR